MVQFFDIIPMALLIQKTMILQGVSLREKEARRVFAFSARQQPRWGSMVSQKNFIKSRNSHLTSLGLFAPRTTTPISTLLKT
jgi:hypothetical protein